MTAPETTPKLFMPRKEFAVWYGMLVRGEPYSEVTLAAWEKAGKGPPPVSRDLTGRDVVYDPNRALQDLQAGDARRKPSLSAPAEDRNLPTSQKASRTLTRAPRQRRDTRKSKFASSA